MKDICKAISNIKQEFNKDDYLRQLDMVKAKIENKKEELVNNLKSKLFLIFLHQYIFLFF